MSTPAGQRRPEAAPVSSALARPTELALQLARPRVARAASAFVVPWLVFLKMVSDRGLRRAWLSSTGKVAVLTLVLGVFAVTSPWTKDFFREDTESVVGVIVGDEPEPDAGGPPAQGTPASAGPSEPAEDTTPPPSAGDARQREELAAALQELAGELEARGPTAPDGSTQQRVADLVAAVAELVDEPPATGPATDGAPPPAAPAAATPVRPTRAHRSQELAAAIRRAREQARSQDPAVTAADRQQAWKSLATAVAVDVAEASRAAKPTETRQWSWPSLSALYAGLALVESVLLGLFRDHQTQLSRRLALATGALPEDPEERPRVRVNWPWLKKKLRRRTRGALIIGSGAIPIALLSVVPGIGHVLTRVATAAWAFYWLAVFTMGTARVAWTHDLQGEPFFIRTCVGARRVPVVGRLVAWFGRLWARLASTVRPGCLTLETAPWEAVGLALARGLSVLPVINGLVRPVLPVAAQLILTARPPVVAEAQDRTAR